MLKILSEYESYIFPFIVLTVVVLLHITINILVNYLNKKFDFAHEDNLRQRKVQTQIIYLKRILKFAIWLVGIGFILLSFEQVSNYGKGLLASAGVASIVIGFAAQKSLGNLIAGLQLAFTQPLRIDDAVFIEGEWGWVEEISLTYIVVKIWDKRRLVLPITYVVEKPFQNWTRTSAQIIGSVFIYVNYSVDIEEIRKEFEQVLTQTPLWDGEVQVLQVVELKEQSIQLRALMSASNSGKAWDLRCFVREKLLSYIDQKNGKPVYSHQQG